MKARLDLREPQVQGVPQDRPGLKALKVCRGPRAQPACAASQALGVKPVPTDPRVKGAIRA